MSLTPLRRFLLPTRARIRIVLAAVLRIFHLIGGWSILTSDMLIGTGNAEPLARLIAVARGRATEQRAIEAETR